MFQADITKYVLYVLTLISFSHLIFYGIVYLLFIISYAPVTIQAVHAAVRSFTGWRNYLPGHLISSCRVTTLYKLDITPSVIT